MLALKKPLPDGAVEDSSPQSLPDFTAYLMSALETPNALTSPLNTAAPPPAVGAVIVSVALLPVSGQSSAEHVAVIVSPALFTV